MRREDKNCPLASKRCFPDLLPLGDTEMSGSSRSSIPKWIFRFRFLIQIYLPSPYALRWRALPLNCLIYLQQSLWLILKGCRQRKSSEEDSSLSATHLITERSKWPLHSPEDGKGGCEEGGWKRYEWRKEPVDPEEPHDRPKTSGSSQACLFTHLTTHSFIYSSVSLSHPLLLSHPTAATHPTADTKHFPQRPQFIPHFISPSWLTQAPKECPRFSISEIQYGMISLIAFSATLAHKGKKSLFNCCISSTSHRVQTQWLAVKLTRHYTDNYGVPPELPKIL